MHNQRHLSGAPACSRLKPAQPNAEHQPSQIVKEPFAPDGRVDTAVPPFASPPIAPSRQANIYTNQLHSRAIHPAIASLPSCVVSARQCLRLSSTFHMPPSMNPPPHPCPTLCNSTTDAAQPATPLPQSRRCSGFPGKTNPASTDSRPSIHPTGRNPQPPHPLPARRACTTIPRVHRRTKPPAPFFPSRLRRRGLANRHQAAHVVLQLRAVVGREQRR